MDAIPGLEYNKNLLEAQIIKKKYFQKSGFPLHNELSEHLLPSKVQIRLLVSQLQVIGVGNNMHQQSCLCIYLFLHFKELVTR